MVIAQPDWTTGDLSGRTSGLRAAGFPASLMGNIAYVRQLYLDLDRYKQAKE